MAKLVVIGISSSMSRALLVLLGEACDAGARLSPACAQIGWSERTVQRWRRPAAAEDGDLRASSERVATQPPNRLSDTERQAALALLNSEEFKDLLKLKRKLQSTFTGGAPRGRSRSIPPARYLDRAYSHLLGDILALHSLRGQQHDLRSLRQSHTRQLRAHELVQLGFLLLAQHDSRGNSQFMAPMQTEVEHWSKVIQSSLFKKQTLH